MLGLWHSLNLSPTAPPFGSLQTPVIVSNLRMTPNYVTRGGTTRLPLSIIIDGLFHPARFNSPKGANEQVVPARSLAEQISGKLYHYGCTTGGPHGATAYTPPCPRTGTNHTIHRRGLYCIGCMGTDPGLPV